ncbi:MAG: mechanosensitive ion channel [Candidatus Thermoplasmatota archaeon]|nr:mechanosensitive ion channel [Candidatus Thermoplasmatota archaeon]MBS3790105.1 mechanosensitive ion channel [Candidatus Thermoplasmatota archaeon]
MPNKAKIAIYSLVLLMVMAMGLSNVLAIEASASGAELFSTESAKSPLVIETLKDVFMDIWENFLNFIPGLVFFIIVVLVGYLVAKLAGGIISKVMKKIGVEKAMRKVGVSKQVKKIGMDSVSGLIGILFFWFIFVIFLQIALDYAGIQTLTAVLTPIVLFIPRLIVAVIVIVIGLYVAEMAVKFLKNFIEKSPMSKELMRVDKMTEKTGYSLMDIIYVFVKVFILLFFLNIALEIIAIPILSDFINPVLLVIPLLIAALAVIVIGLVVTNYVVDFIIKMLKEFEVEKLIEPIESMIDREGITLKVISYVLKLFVMLIFVQIAVGILNRQGMFNQLAELVNTVILWIPNLLVALFIGLIGFWIATWLHEKVIEHGKELELPFVTFMAKGVQILVIYIAIVMALAQIGIEVPILYLVFGIAVGAVFLGLGVGFAYGSKDVFLNLVGSIQSDQTLEEGTRVKVDEYEGVIKEVGRYSVELETRTGKKVHIPHSKLAGAVIEETE